MFGLTLQSPDINVIENGRRMIKIRLQRVQHTIKNRKEYVDAVLRIWASFTPGYIEALYKTIPRRITAVIAAKGHAS